MELERFFGLAALVLGTLALAVGSLLASQGTLTYYQPSSSAVTQTLLNLTGQNLRDGGERTFQIPVVTRPSAQISVTLQSSGPVDISVFDANGPLTSSATGQTAYTRIIIPSYDTVASIAVANSGLSPVTYTLVATESYTALAPQSSQVYTYAGYIGLATGVGLLLLGLAVLIRRSQLNVAGSTK